MSFKKKFNKLKRDPKLFFRDLARKKGLNNLVPIKTNCNHNYTIVSAVYNVEKYLDDYFNSIVKQSVDFKKHIKIICVDDGSTDNSAEIIKKWQKKYPDNITYLYKENGGQASARNLGLKEVDTEWVTFTDPDDFLDLNFFAEVDKSICEEKNIKLVVSNTQFFDEITGNFNDNHPLKYRFKQTKTIHSVSDLKDKIILEAGRFIFCTKDILDFGLEFNTSIKPNFEDGDFGLRYLLNSKSGNVIFLQNAIYYYRKRGDFSSTLDTAWEKLEKYSDIFTNGYLPLLASYKEKFGKVPVFVQRIVLYDLFWYIKNLMNTQKTNFLTDSEKANFLNYFQQCFNYIDSDTIVGFNIAGCFIKHKIAMLGRFKQKKPPFQVVYVENIDLNKKQILLSYYYLYEVQDAILLDNEDISPIYQKTVYNDFLGEPFVYERRYWIPFTDAKQVLKIFISGKKSILSLKGNQAVHKQYKDGLKVSDILTAFQSNKYINQDDSWILMDRDTQADDNAEHLYRWLRDNHPEQKIYFAINQDSQDWDRLEKDGFNLLAFATSEYEKKLKNCSKLISSEASGYICSYFRDNYDFKKHFIWLQHGVTKDDLSNWLNSKSNINLLVASTTKEYSSIAFGDNYKLSEKEVVLAGFPRHDSLLRNNKTDSKIVLVMPSWRSYLFAKDLSFTSSEKALRTDFTESEYYKAWSNFLSSRRLQNLLSEYDFELVFAPHFLMQPYLEQFDLPQSIRIWSKASSNESIQDLFQNSRFMITDYSSTAFEMAYLGKGTLYYQFDKEEFFRKHTYKQGYFEYERDGFGAVAYTEEDLLNNLEQILKNNGNFAEKYHKNMDIFPAKDGKNCERVYQAILKLDNPENKEYPDLKILRERLEQAEKNNAWKLIFLRAEQLKEYEQDEEKISQLEELQIQAALNGQLSQYYEKILPLAYEKNPQDESISNLFLPILYKNKDWKSFKQVYESLQPDSGLKQSFYDDFCEANQNLNYETTLDLFNKQDLKAACENLLPLNTGLSPKYLNLALNISLAQEDYVKAQLCFLLLNNQNIINQSKK